MEEFFAVDVQDHFIAGLGNEGKVPVGAAVAHSGRNIAAFCLNADNFGNPIHDQTYLHVMNSDDNNAGFVIIFPCRLSELQTHINDRDYLAPEVDNALEVIRQAREP